MEARAPVRLVWRFMLRRVWQRNFSGERCKVWRKIWQRVPETDTSPSAMPSGWDTQSITYADCEEFFEAVSEGSEKKLTEMVNDTHGPEVTTELAQCYNEDGETPLLMAIRLQKLSMVKYLLQNLKAPVSQHGRLVWKGVEYPQVPPLFVAILCGQPNIIRDLIVAQTRSAQSFTLIDSIISSSNDRQQKIDMLELLGAAYLCFSPLLGTRLHGKICWTNAMNLRNSTTDGWQVIPKPQVFFSSEVAHKAVGYAFEFTAQEQLDQLFESDLQSMTQSVLVGQRILNGISPGVNLFLLEHLCQYVKMCHMKNEHSRVVCIAIVFLKYLRQQQQLENLKTCKITSSILDFTTKSFRKMRDGPPDNRNEFTFANLMIVFEFASVYSAILQNDEPERLSCTLYRLAWNILEMVSLIVEMFAQLNANEIQQFKRCLYRFICSDHRWGDSLENLLHMICRCDGPLQSQINFDFDFETYEDDDFESSSLNSEDDDVDSSSLNSDNEEDGNDGSSSGCSSCGYRPRPHYYGPGDHDIDLEMLDIISLNSDNEEDGNDGSSSGCSSCGYRPPPHDYGPVDHVIDLGMLDIRLDMYEEDADFRAEMSNELQISVMRLFLELGADPNSTDAMSQTPLHYLAMYSQDFDPVQVLIEHGGHIDQVDRFGLTPIETLERWQEDLAAAEVADPRLQSLISNALPLTCLAAKVLRENRVLFDKEIPAALHSFVLRH